MISCIFLSGITRLTLYDPVTYMKSNLLITRPFLSKIWFRKRRSRVPHWEWAMESHYSDAIMSASVSEITGVSIVCTLVCSGANQRKHQSSALLAFVRGINRWQVNSPHKRPVTRKIFPFDDVIMLFCKFIVWSVSFTGQRHQCVSNGVTAVFH